MSNSKISWEEAVEELRSQPEHAELVEGCFFDDPLLEACKRYRSGVEWREVRTRAGHPGKVLDVGAGRGIASYAFAADGWDVTALEPDPGAVVGAGAIRQMAAESGLSIVVDEEWGEKLPYEDRTFDLVFCRQVLHHSRNLSEFCREAHRVLRPGGRLLALRDHVLSKETDLPLFLAGHPLHRLYGGEHAFTLRQYLDSLKSAGFRITAVLNPWASEMNSFPYSYADLKAVLAAKLRWPWPALIPDVALRLAGWTMRHPGRLYSFAARRPQD